MLSHRAHAATRLALAASVVAVTALAVPSASADSVLVVQRSTEGEKFGAKGVDVSAARDTWTFTITAMTGKPSQLVVRIESGSPDQTIYSFASTHPKVGQTFTTYSPVPSGVHKVFARISGGPVTPEDSVTVSVKTSS